MFVLFVLLAFSLAPVRLQTENYFCDKRYTVISSFSQDDCPTVPEKEWYYLRDNEHGCLPSCEKTVKPMRKCNPKKCRPGYNCVGDGDNTKCVMEENSCRLYKLDYDNDNLAYREAKFKPECLKDGTWAPKQWKGEPGIERYFCYDKIGNRLHGHSWMPAAQNMTCACSRKRAELEEDPIKNWFVSLHCDKLGNYEELQCSHEHCWCVEPQTGDLTSVVVPESWMKQLPCYNKTIIGEQYLRICESELYARAKIIREFEIHGTFKITYTPLYCAADGGYGSFTELGGQLYCIWKNPETKLVGKTETDELKKQMNCNCDRDAQLYKEEGKNPQKLKCDGLGNYEPVQKLPEGFVCVDSDGFPKHDDIRDKMELADCLKMK